MTPQMFTYMVIFFGALAFISSIAMIIISYANKKRFSEICRLYENEFGFNSLPISASLLKDADIIGFSSGYSIRNEFIIKPLIFGKKSPYSKNNDVNFMRNLPVNIKIWFIAEFYLGVSVVVFFLLIAACQYFD